MNEWVAVWQALSVMDAVRRRWARELGLEPAELAVVMLLAAGEALGPAELAWRSGRARQQEFRTLRSLHARGLVCPARRAADGSVQAWVLSADGLRLATRVDARAQAWTRMCSPHVELAMLARALQRVTRLLVNQPTTRGWRQGLAVPRERWAEIDYGAEQSGQAVAAPVAPAPDPREPRDPEANFTQLERPEREGVSEPVIVADGAGQFAQWCDSDDPMAAFWRRLNR